MPLMMVSTMAAIHWDVENPRAIFKGSWTRPLRSRLPIWGFLTWWLVMRVSH